MHNVHDTDNMTSSMRPETGHYSNAPIIEAVIDIQVTLPSDFSDTSFTELADKLKDEFPIRNNISAVEMQLSTEEESAPKVTHAHNNVGIRLTDNDNSRILQLRKIGFSYSHLPPYSDWEHFGAEAKRYWDLFVQYCNPEKVIRCAVRYINRIDIPKVPAEIQDYLNLYPKLPEGIPQTVTGMHLQLQMPQEDLGSQAIINEAVVEPAIPGGLSIVVDTDIFTLISIEPDSPEVWEILEKFRVRKNEMFEAFITDETRRLIK